MAIIETENPKYAAAATVQREPKVKIPRAQTSSNLETQDKQGGASQRGWRRQNEWRLQYATELSKLLLQVVFTACERLFSEWKNFRKFPLRRQLKSSKTEKRE